jgi:hypothetical protein
MRFSKSKLAAYHHGANEGVTDDGEGAGLLSEGGRDREPEGGDQRRKEHEEEERSQERERNERNERGKGHGRSLREDGGV